MYENLSCLHAMILSNERHLWVNKDKFVERSLYLTMIFFHVFPHEIQLSIY